MISCCLLPTSFSEYMNILKCRSCNSSPKTLVFVRQFLSVRKLIPNRVATLISHPVCVAMAIVFWPIAEAERIFRHSPPSFFVSLCLVLYIPSLLHVYRRR
ncbi:uncharacterized protein V1518DRAFT_77614 [Limtongia smithiae]|uniref:uncharacterized protein n=1 Tax=Limtongia smithiae TaxID=1125753 RepID=UPI0034CD9651